MKLFIDINTGEARAALNANPISHNRLAVGDIEPIQIVLTDAGVIVTGAQLPAGNDLNVLISSFPLGGAPLVMASGFATVFDVASSTLNLSASTLSQFFANMVPSSAEFWTFAFQVVLVTPALRETLFSGRALVYRSAFVPLAAVASGSPITDASGNTITDASGNSITNA